MEYYNLFLGSRNFSKLSKKIKIVVRKCMPVVRGKLNMQKIFKSHNGSTFRRWSPLVRKINYYLQN